MIAATHENNFNILRLLFASLVVFSHAFALLGLEEPVIYGRTLGNLSVHAFFAISGYLICQSYVRSPELLSFLVKRFLRIVPGLVVAIIATKLIAGVCGGFKTNPVPYIANGPVWTLTWEVMCYFGLVLLGQTGVLNSKSIPAFFAAAWLVYIINISNASDEFAVVVPLAMMFLAGAFVAATEDDQKVAKAPLLSVFGLVAILNYDFFQSIHLWIASNVPFLWGPALAAEQANRIIYIAAFPLVIVYLGKFSRPIVKVENDISYGIYIYGWPIAQALVFLAMQNKADLAPVPFFVLTMLVTVPIAFASWKLIEKPSLSLKRLAIRRNPGGPVSVTPGKHPNT